MNLLAEYIREGVDRRGFRYVFDQRLDQVWPLEADADRKAQREQIREFAEQHGWHVSFIREGRIAIFRKPKPAKKGTNSAGVRGNAPSPDGASHDGASHDGASRDGADGA
jgi:hypothetical protein